MKFFIQRTKNAYFKTKQVSSARLIMTLLCLRNAQVSFCCS